MEANFLNLLMFLCFLTVTEGMLLLSKAVNTAYNISVVVHLSMKCAKIRHNHLDFCTYEFEEYIGLLPLISSNP